MIIWSNMRNVCIFKVGILSKEEFKSLTGSGAGRPGHVPDTKWPWLTLSGRVCQLIGVAVATEGATRKQGLSHLTKGPDLQTKEFGCFTQDSWVPFPDAWFMEGKYLQIWLSSKRFSFIAKLLFWIGFSPVSLFLYFLFLPELRLRFFS